MDRKYRKGIHLTIKSNQKKKNDSPLTTVREKEFIAENNTSKELLLATASKTALNSVPQIDLVEKEYTMNKGKSSQPSLAFKNKTSVLPQSRNISEHHRFKPAKVEINQIKQKGTTDPSESDIKLVVLVVLSILIPPLAIYLKTEQTNSWFWISLGLCLASLFVFFFSLAGLIWLTAIAIALLVVFDQIK